MTRWVATSYSRQYPTTIIPTPKPREELFFPLMECNPDIKIDQIMLEEGLGGGGKSMAEISSNIQEEQASLRILR